MITKSKNPAEGDAQRHQYRLAYHIENLDGKHPQSDPNQCCNAVLSYSHCDPGAKRARLHHKLYHADKFSKVHYHSQGCGHQNYQSQSHRNLTDAGKRGIPSQYRRTVTNPPPDKVRPNDSERMARNQALAEG